MYLFPNLHHFHFHHCYNRYYFEDDLDVILQHQEIGHQVPNRAWVDFLTYVSRMRTGRIGTLFIKKYVEAFAKLTKLTEHLAIRYGLDLQLKPFCNLSYENDDFSESFDFKGSCVSKPPRRLVTDGMSVKSYEELPHESLLPIYGPAMKSLNLKLVPATDHHDKESAAYRMLDGDVFNPVFEHCLVLKRLRVTDGSFNSFDPSRFKSTENLQLVEFQSSFGCLLLREKKTNPTAIEVYLKITMDTQTFYYEFYDKNKVKSSTSGIFETFKNDSKKSIIEIRCFDIEKLVVELTVDIYSIGCHEGDSITFPNEENCKDTSVPDHFYSGW
ncbi:hypothetical protein INT47_002490 [Mucor saturninus]|uniref:Uncharacterized protein n=1 Tax=Mucor saturninus TaxID=64648 RepID=A0A8H7VBM1_9FUNG|nr:hypothetical protein INT47_002490 [Mucor saturninus]